MMSEKIQYIQLYEYIDDELIWIKKYKERVSFSFCLWMKLLLARDKT